MESKKIAVIILAVILVAAFFMPWIKFMVGVSAWDLVFGPMGKDAGPVKFVLALIPLSAIGIIAAAAMNKDFLPKMLLYSIPLLTLIIMFVYGIVKAGGLHGMDSDGLGTILKVIGVGFWLTLISSIALPVLSRETAPTASAA